MFLFPQHICNHMEKECKINKNHSHFIHLMSFHSHFYCNSPLTGCWIFRWLQVHWNKIRTIFCFLFFFCHQKREKKLWLLYFIFVVERRPLQLKESQNAYYVHRMFHARQLRITWVKVSYGNMYICMVYSLYLDEDAFYICAPHNASNKTNT